MAEAQGDANILFKKGASYFFGSGVLQDYNRAFEYFLDASELGSQVADAMLAHMYEEGLGCERNMAKSFIHAKKGETCDSVELAELAKYILGLLYFVGFYDENTQLQHDNLKAYEYFSTCKSQGKSYYYKGLMEYYGLGTNKDATKAAETFYEGIKMCKDNSIKGRAAMCLGGLYYKGEGVARNYELAWTLLRKGANLAIPKLIQAAKSPLTNSDIANYNYHWGNEKISLWTPFSWKMYNLFQETGKAITVDGVKIDLLQQALMILFKPDCWALSGIEYNFDDM